MSGDPVSDNAIPGSGGGSPDGREKPRAREPGWRPRLLRASTLASLPALTLVFGLLLSAAAAYLTALQLERDARRQFEDAVAEAHGAIEARLRSYTDVLLAVKGLFTASDSVNREAFKEFIDSFDLSRRYPGIQVVHYGQRMSPAQKQAFESMAGDHTGIDTRFYPGFRVKPAGERPEYVVVRLAEPAAGNEAVLGLDLGGDEVRRAALARMIESGRLTASGVIALALDPKKHPGFAMRLPIYRKGLPIATAAQRREAFSGVVSASFVVIDLMKGVLGKPFLERIRVRIYDTGAIDDPAGLHAPTSENLMFDSRRLLAAPPGSESPDDLATAGLASVSSLEVGGRLWGMHFSARSGAFNAFDRSQPLAVFAGLMAISVLLAGLVRSLATSRASAVALAERMTASLRKSEASLEESDRLRQQLIEVLPNPIYFKGTDGRYLGVNRAWEQFFGLPREEFLGKTVHDLYPDNAAVAGLLHEKDQALWDNPGSQVYEASITTRDGRRHDAIYYKATYTRADGSVAGLIGTIVDITERKRAEADMRESNRRFRDLVESTNGIVWEADASTFLFSSVSGNAERMLGYPPADWLQPGFWSEHIHPEDREQAVQYCVNSTKRSEDHEFEYRFIARDGRAVWLSDIVRVVVEDGKPRWLRGLMVDITERKRAEAARVSLEAQLRESQKMEAIGTLAGGIAHDFNNALATILGNVELARLDVGANVTALESLEEIRKAGSRARNLVQQILSFSRRKPSERTRVALAPIVEESARLLRATLPARLSLEVHCEPDLPPVLADATQMEQVVINLCTNAMQAIANDPGRIRIRLEAVRLDEALAGTHPGLRELHGRHPGRTVRLSVSDDGPGIEAETLERIFEPFFTTKSVNEGTGLGLSVVHGIVKAHEGAILVESRPGHGATFTIYLPAHDQPAVAPGPRELRPAAAPSSGAERRVNILFIDDDASLVFLVKRLLERRGYRVSGYADQREALAALRADPVAFDLVVTDYNMPGMSGLDVAREVRAVRGDLPVAVASGFIDETLRAQAGGAGVRELIFKANAIEDFCEAVQRMAQAAGQSPATAAKPPG